jgi:UDP-glucose 4-epimerase
MKRIAITGSSGYLGSCLIRYLARREPGIRILGLDVVSPADAAGHEYVRLDIGSRELAPALQGFQPDTVVHMGFVVRPMHNEREMRRINVEGSRNVLAATAAAGAERLLVTSSSTVFGARPDNPVPLDDAWPGRAGGAFRYAADKVELEAMLAAFAGEHREIRVSCVRPCVVGGPHMDNYLRRHLFRMPVILLLDGVDSALQLVHEDDVSAAIYEILAQGGSGSYNLAAADTFRLSELAELTGRRWLRAPFWLGRVLAWLAWTTRFPPHEYPPSFLDYVRYPWIAAPNRLTRELGFRFRYSTQETLRMMIDQERSRK